MRICIFACMQEREEEEQPHGKTLTRSIEQGSMLAISNEMKVLHVAVVFAAELKVFSPKL